MAANTSAATAPHRRLAARGAAAAADTSKLLPSPYVVWPTLALLLVTVGRIGEVVPGLQGMQLAKIAIGFATLGLLYSQLRQQTISLSAIRLSRWFYAFMALIALSFPLSIWKSQSLPYIIWNGSVMLLLFLLVGKAAFSPTNLRRLLYALVISALVLATGALINYAGGRAQSSRMLDSNDLAYVLATLLPISIALAVASSGARRWLLFATSGFILAAALLTQSRGGLVGLIFVALYLVFVGIRNSHRRARLPLGAVAVRGVVVLVLALATWSLLPTDTKTRLSTISDVQSDYNYAGQSQTGRIEIWRRNLGALAQRPIGYGIATFPAVDGNSGGRYMTAHNSIVQASVELGVLGGIVFVGLYILAWAALSAQLRGAADGRAPAWLVQRVAYLHGLRAALLANFAAGFFLSQAYAFVLCALLGTVAALLAAVDRDSGARAAPEVAQGSQFARRGLPRNSALPVGR
jgi:O-antigen ligase